MLVSAETLKHVQSWFIHVPRGDRGYRARRTVQLTDRLGQASGKCAAAYPCQECVLVIADYFVRRSYPVIHTALDFLCISNKYYTHNTIASMSGTEQKKQIGEDQFHTPELDAARQEIWDNGIKQVSRPPRPHRGVCR